MSNTTTTAAADYTSTTVKVNDVEVTLYGGTARPIPTYALPGHVTGWTRRNGARTTYAELTCTCRLTGETYEVPAAEGQNTWISYGEDGWIDRLNAAALAHVENVTAHGIMVRPAKGDRTRKSDRTRTDVAGMIRAAVAAGAGSPDGVAEIVGEVLAGRVAYAPDGTRFELAADRQLQSREPLRVR